MRNRRFLSICALAVVGVASWAMHGWAAEGQGPADPDAHIKDLRLGTYWYGAQASKEALKGKVVLVTIYGS